METEHKNVDRHIRLIVTRLKKYQREDGSWADNNFVNALIAYSLSEMDAASAMPMLRKSIDFILSQKSDAWTWNYSSAKQHDGTHEKVNTKYPDDLDDTFCSLIAIHQIKPELIDGSALAHIAEVLMNADTKDGGPYFTWTNHKNKTWNDVDPVVNANISCFAVLRGIEMPEVTRYIDVKIGTRNIKSKYYHNQFLACYFIAKNYRGARRERLIRKIRKNLRGLELSITDIALAACAFIYLDSPPNNYEPIVREIIQRLNSKNTIATRAGFGQTRIPSEKQVTGKSIAMALPSILALAQAGVPIKSPNMKKLIRFFRHYIFVKQMSDNIRDWHQDSDNGIITRVTARIMLVEKQDIMNNALIPSAREIVSHCRTAEKTLKSCGLFSKDIFLSKIIGEYKHTAEKFLSKNTSNEK